MLRLHMLRPVYIASFPLCGRSLSTKGLPVWADQYRFSSLSFLWVGSPQSIFSAILASGRKLETELTRWQLRD